ncbi:MAG: nucleotide exchange factor GrpE [Alphaproteobacteria bacterium]|nr:nucleotide exchange factor GrpE [Alphaproteobacteria bacterium]
MSNKWAKSEDEGKPAEATEPSPADVPSTAAGAGDAFEDSPPTADTADPVMAMAAAIADLKDQLLRALAETENIRRRSQKEKEDIGRFAVSNLARDMLNVADNLHRVIEAIPEEAVKGDHALNTLYEGVELVERDLQQVFERHGIVQIAPLGEKFDHNLHQAMFEVDDPDAEPGTVVQLMAPGYLIHGRLLRPAMVGVAKGGQKKDASGADAQDVGTDRVEDGNGQPSGDDGAPPHR